MKVLDAEAEKEALGRPIRVLHLSDLHFRSATSYKSQLQPLCDDLRHGESWGAAAAIDDLDYLVVSGDFTDKGASEGFELAYCFLSGLTKEFGLSAERCVFVPGNHDVKETSDAFESREAANGSTVQVQSDKYPFRIKPFSDGFYHKFLQRPYPTDYAEQGIAIPYWEAGLQFLTLNSCWQIDQFNRKRSGINHDAVAHCIAQAQDQEKAARKNGQLAGPILRVAVWHHAVTGSEAMHNTEFLGLLQNIGVRVALHGDVHESRRGQNEPWRRDRPLYIAGAGAFGAPQEGRPESTPRLYNLLEIARDLKTARIHTRQQPKADGPWKPWNEWPRTDGADGAVSYYDITWAGGRR